MFWEFRGAPPQETGPGFWLMSLLLLFRRAKSGVGRAGAQVLSWGELRGHIPMEISVQFRLGSSGEHVEADPFPKGCG